jgi:hypothetical protein
MNAPIAVKRTYLVSQRPAVRNLIRMSGYMDKKLASINANRVVDLSILDELRTKRIGRTQK